MYLAFKEFYFPCFKRILKSTLSINVKCKKLIIVSKYCMRMPILSRFKNLRTSGIQYEELI